MTPTDKAVVGGVTGDAAGAAVTGKAAVAGVIGWPVAHSLSPRVHGYWLRKYGIDGAYVPLAVRPEDIEDAIRALGKLGLRGANVTVPHKERALRAVDRLSADARRIGAINTVIVEPDGSILGHNTDACGFTASLRAGCPSWSAAAGPAVVIGAGGAARAVCTALLDAGVADLRLVNRTAARAETLAADLGAPSTRVFRWDARHRALADASLLVNTTTLGMTGNDALPLDIASLPPSAVVVDIVYRPLTTPLLADAAARGHATVDGLGMLLHQARPGFKAWFGVDPDVDQDLRDHVLAALTGES